VVKSYGSERQGKGMAEDHVRCGLRRRTQVNHWWGVEKPLTVVKTEILQEFQDKSGGNLITVQMATGIKMAWT